MPEEPTQAREAGVVSPAVTPTHIFCHPGRRARFGEESRDLLLTFPQPVPPEKIILGLCSGTVRLAPLWNCECSNSVGVEMKFAQDGSPGWACG